MTAGHSWGGMCRAVSNHPAAGLAPGEGFSSLRSRLIQGAEFLPVLMSECITPTT